MSPPRVTAVHPIWAIEGGCITIEGVGFPVDGPQLPEVLIGGLRSRVVSASPTRIAALVPGGLESGTIDVRVDGAAGEPVSVGLAARFATGLHQVHNPEVDH